jgi:hypothetical protein
MDLTPRQFQAIQECLKANPGANAPFLALRTGLSRDLVDAALRMLNR